MEIIAVNWDTFATEMTGNNVPINLNSSLLNMEQMTCGSPESETMYFQVWRICLHLTHI